MHSYRCANVRTSMTKTKTENKPADVYAKTFGASLPQIFPPINAAKTDFPAKAPHIAPDMILISPRAHA